MAPLPCRPQSPIPEARNNLSFGNNGMRAFGDIQWTSPDRLKELLRTSGGLRAPAVSAKWIRGQLEFYNIFYETNWGDEELADALETAVRDGNCKKLPWDIGEIQKELQSNFKENVGAAFRELRAWCVANPQDADTLFEHLMSPTAEAIFDIERFISRHWPETEVEDRLQRPADKKTHWAIALPCYRPKDSLVRKKTEDRRLNYEVSGFGFEQTFIIGWAIDPIFRLRQKYNNHDYNRIFRDRESEVKRLYSKHVAYCNNQPPSNGRGPAYDLLRQVGHWIVRCDKLVPMFDISTTMTLDVHNIPHYPPVLADSKYAQIPINQRPIEQRGIIAAFDFGVLRGTMAISVDPFVLPPFQKSEECFDEQPYFHKRLYFEWTGYSQRGKLQRSESLANTGFLDFDEDCTIFKGVFQTDNFGGTLVIRGYKISDKPQTVPRSFYNYLHKPEHGSLGSGSMEESEDSDKSEAIVVDEEEEEKKREAARKKIIADIDISWEDEEE